MIPARRSRRSGDHNPDKSRSSAIVVTTGREGACTLWVMPALRRDLAAALDVSTAALAVLLIVLVLASVGGPLAGVVWGLTHPAQTSAGPTTTMQAFSWLAAGRTLVYCSLIALVAVVLALPAGWCLRRYSWGWTAALCVPLLLPSYLPFAGWGVLRGPGTIVGDWLARREQSWTLLVSDAIAVWGLALWSFPIAALAIGLAARRVPEALLEALRLEPASRFRGGREVLALLMPGVVLGAGTIGLVMIGSAVPLHLAQVQTLAIHLWKYMSLTPEPVRAWIAAWPLLILAIAGGVLGGRAFCRATDSSSTSPDAASGRINPVAKALAVLVWALAVLAPLAFNLLSVRDWSLIPAFWIGSSRALLNSLQTAAITGILVAIISLCVWRLASERSRSARGLARSLSGVLIASALTPGVLIGSAGVALAAATWFPLGLARTNMVLVLVHVARFGALGAMVGLWLAAQETSDQRASRELYAPGTSGWLRTELAPAWSAPVGVGLAAGALSLHEIEATVLVAPPGSGNLAQRLLDLLHYARDEQLAAAGINIVASGLVLALLAGALIAKSSRSAREAKITTTNS